ncbi:MAG: hypothetical protein K2M65_01035 [Muribaculaceae bacterium]|nr:hypothetical protein [Muribaculaceae bacterium]
MPTELPEVEVASPIHKVMHMLAYVREYSTLSTYSDTVFLFREKMVDFMLNPPEKSSFKGWTNPRVIKAKSYYHITNSLGLDTVSDESNYHFSWSDWIGVGAPAKLPATLQTAESATDTLRGKYGPTEVWAKNDERISVDIDILADSVNRKWVPNLSSFFRQNVEFENFRLRYNYDNMGTNSVFPIDLTGYSYNIESNGRGHGMFMFNRVNEPFFVSTYAEVYIIDKEFITIKEAKQWQRCRFDNAALDIYKPNGVPELQPSIQRLMERVNNVNKEEVRLALTPDHKIGYQTDVSRNFQFGYRALTLLKQLTGISSYKFHKKAKRNWREFRKQRVIKNQQTDTIDTHRSLHSSTYP